MTFRPRSKLGDCISISLVRRSSAPECKEKAAFGDACKQLQAVMTVQAGMQEELTLLRKALRGCGDVETSTPSTLPQAPTPATSGSTTGATPSRIAPPAWASELAKDLQEELGACQHQLQHLLQEQFADLRQGLLSEIRTQQASLPLEKASTKEATPTSSPLMPHAALHPTFGLAASISSTAPAASPTASGMNRTELENHLLAGLAALSGAKVATPQTPGGSAQLAIASTMHTMTSVATVAPAKNDVSSDCSTEDTAEEQLAASKSELGAGSSAPVLQLAGLLAKPQVAPLATPQSCEAEVPASMGSAGHDIGLCKPCAFIFKGGCQNGINCKFCHRCDSGEKKRRQKEKASQLATLKQPQQHHPQLEWLGASVNAFSCP